MTPSLPRHLSAALARVPPAPLCVAFSGGPDSSALLHALASLPDARQRGLRALHVDHGLHPHSARWASHARAFCDALEVPCEVVRVEVDLRAGLGLEAAAREARHAALATALRAGEWLLFGHHRDDQVETVLLKLLRGAGPEGLGGMRAQRRFGDGQLWRPLLELPKARVQAYVEAHALSCLDDPANSDLRLARNTLRHEILPRLARHWPQAADSIVHSAALSRDAADALRTRWMAALEDLRDPGSDSLDATGWQALAPALREPLLDHWLHRRGLPAPTTAQRRQIERQIGAQPGRLPCVRWPGAELHIWRGRLWALTPARPIDPNWQASWDGTPLTLPDGGRLTQLPPMRLRKPATVRLRRGGEHIKPAGDRHTRELRDLFQQAAIPPWQREACPLLVEGDTVIAVADRWISARGRELLDGASLCWTPAR